MFENLKKISRTEFKKANFKSFFFFLIFSTLIWFLVQFSKSYTKVLTVPLQFENYPKDKIVEKKDENLELRIQESGFRLAWFKFFGPKVKVDLSSLPSDGSYLTYSLREHRGLLRKKLPMNFDNVSFLDQEIRIPYQQKEVKTVAVKPHVNLNYAPGYASEGNLIISPDSVKISGPSKMLDTISELYTKTVNLKNIKKNVDGKIGIDNSKHREITLFQNKVNYQIKVEKFTEGEVEVPIEITNVPKDAEISIFPEKLKVTFKVSLENYDKIDSVDFKIVCDFKNVPENQNFFIPIIAQQPKIVRNVSLSPRKVQFVIKK